jgi:hypothetical protein
MVSFKHQKSVIFVALKNLPDFWDQKSLAFLGLKSPIGDFK